MLHSFIARSFILIRFYFLLFLYTAVNDTQIIGNSDYRFLKELYFLCFITFLYNGPELDDSLRMGQETTKT